VDWSLLLCDEDQRYYHRFERSVSLLEAIPLMCLADFLGIIGYHSSQDLGHFLDCTATKCNRTYDGDAIYLFHSVNMG
jgi:hypothetical protein